MDRVEFRADIFVPIFRVVFLTLGPGNVGKEFLCFIAVVGLVDIMFGGSVAEVGISGAESYLHEIDRVILIIGTLACGGVIVGRDSFVRFERHHSKKINRRFCSISSKPEKVRMMGRQCAD